MYGINIVDVRESVPGWGTVDISDTRPALFAAGISHPHIHPSKCYQVGRLARPSLLDSPYTRGYLAPLQRVPALKGGQIAPFSQLSPQLFYSLSNESIPFPEVFPQEPLSVPP